jgi:lactoylglutathione lyase
MISVRKSLLTIFARDIARSAEFYGKTLGLGETYRFPRDGAPLHVEFDAGGHTVAVSSDAGLASHGMPPSSPGHSFELGLKVDDVDAAVAELRGAGVTVLREPFDSEAGNRVAYIADPDGNWVSMYHNLA